MSVILFRQNNEPIAAWKFPLTLNTVVATLGTISRSTLAFAMSACIGQQKWSWFRKRSDTVGAFERFDEASRGPWGGTRLFFWLRLRHWAALGALVTMGTVAFDPFFQAILSTYGQLDNIATSIGASIGQALTVDGGYILDYKTGGMMAVNTSSGTIQYTQSKSRPDFGIVSSIYSGFHNATLKPVAIECPTGNCTWPAFVSAAICSSCEDVSSELVFKSANGTDNGSNVPSANNLQLGMRSYSIFSLPESEIRNWDGNPDIRDTDWYRWTTGAGIGTLTLMTTRTLFRARQTLRHSDLRTIIMAFVIIKAPEEWLESKVPWESSHPVATECALYFCANAYQAKSENGVLQEDVVGSWTTEDPAWNETSKNLTSGERELIAEGYDLYDPTYNRGNHDLLLEIPQEQNITYPVPKINISHTLIRSTIDYLESFTSSPQLPSGEEKLLIAYPVISAPPVFDALWNSTNLTRTFDNVARSLTNQIRNTSPDRQQGVVRDWVIHIHVDWAYMAFPVGMLLTGILYVVLIIVESTRLRVPVWKERTLPTLLYGFDDETQRLLRKREGNEREKIVESSVRYDYDEQEDCLRLVAH
ncbi:DUF3176 domain containing protein [Pyrenophora tritici-repentis]|nr:hypothetical protein L13192_07974 [Pyrenophora tritici-repentis]KAI2475121.1 DUF3176 domain containing protein [Pyrenophora tritici-repentis]